MEFNTYLNANYETLFCKVSPALFLEPSGIAPHLPLTGSQYHKLIISKREEESKLNEDTTVSENEITQSDKHTTDGSIT